MFKKIALLVSVTFPLSISQSFANWEFFEESNPAEGPQTIRAVWKKTDGDRKFFLNSAKADSLENYTGILTALPLKDGYPAVEGSEQRFKLQNTDRQEAQNPYHLYTLSSQIDAGDENLPLGFVQFGRMPSLGYSEGVPGYPIAHHPIIENFMDLGITEQEHPAGGLNNDNLKRIENRGLTMILPLFTPEISPENRVGAIEACYELVAEFTKRGKTLPIEGTLPYRAVGLFHPSDSNIEAFQANGFTADTHEGYGWFYPKDGVPQPRTMVTRLVEIEEEGLEP